jgi:hypothetical protein
VQHPGGLEISTFIKNVPLQQLSVELLAKIVTAKTLIFLYFALLLNQNLPFNCNRTLLGSRGT